MSQSQLLLIKNQIMGSYGFAAQYQQEPAPFGGGMIKWAWFQPYINLPQESPIRIVQSWDTASKAEEMHDFSVCSTWYEYPHGYYLVDVFRERLEFPDLRRAIMEKALQYHPHAILIEDKGSGIHLIQDLVAETSLPLIPVIPDTDKISRALAQTAKIEAGKIFIPADAPWLSDFQNETSKFPNAKFDDQVDSLSQALRWLSAPVQEEGFFVL